MIAGGPIENEKDWIRGQWLSLDRIAMWCKTLDVQLVGKKELYEFVISLRPIPAKTYNEQD